MVIIVLVGGVEGEVTQKPGRDVGRGALRKCLVGASGRVGRTDESGLRCDTELQFAGVVALQGQVQRGRGTEGEILYVADVGGAPGERIRETAPEDEFFAEGRPFVSARKIDRHGSVDVLVSGQGRTCRGRVVVFRQVGLLSEQHLFGGHVVLRVAGR